MAPKRSLELAVEDDVHTLTNDDKEPPIKLRNLSLPHTPLPKSSYSSSTTRTPFPSRPFDSPSNPFGRKRIRALTHTLPPPTSFSQHLPLRFQLVRPGISPRLGGVYRVVQVPLSYTFVHLRCLIAFLYGGGCVVDNEDRHLFEVVKRAAVYNQSYKPCQIKSGVTVVKLSSVRDPCRYRPEGDEDALGDGDGDANVGEGDESEAERTDDCEEGKGWIWAEEEDFTLAHAWPRGGDISRGIIYHHTPTTAIHITINTAPIPKRKGISNIPYVFYARGRVRLLPPAPLPLPRPVFSVPTHKLKSPLIPHRRTLANKDVNRDNDQHDDEDAGSDHQEEDDEEEDDPTAIPSRSQWNKFRVFASYLKLAQQQGNYFISSSLYAQDEDEDEENERNGMDPPNSTPGLTHSHTSSPISSSSDLLTSPLFSQNHISVAPCIPQTHGFPISAFDHTPAPPQAQWQRLRIERVSKRLERLKKGEWMCARDEDLDEEDTVDELAGDEVDKPFTKPVLKPGEVWDPFGDEYEV